MGSSKSQNETEYKCSCFYVFGECVWPTPCEPKENGSENVVDADINKEEQLSLL